MACARRRRRTRTGSTFARDIKSANNDITTHWDALKAKVSADMDAWNEKIAQLKHDRGVKRADNHAERLEWEASFAVDYVAAAIEEAKSAVLDAIVGRIEAEQARRS